MVCSHLQTTGRPRKPQQTENVIRMGQKQMSPISDICPKPLDAPANTADRGPGAYRGASTLALVVLITAVPPHRARGHLCTSLIFRRGLTYELT